MSARTVENIILKLLQAAEYNIERAQRADRGPNEDKV